MGRIMSLLTVILLMKGSALAQVHVKGSRFIDLTVGTVDGFRFKPTQDNSGYWASIGTGRYNKMENSWRWQLNILQKNYAIPEGLNGNGKAIPVRYYTISFGHGYKLFVSKRRVIYCNVLPQILAGYESINNNRAAIDNYHILNPSGFRAGAKVGIELEVENLLIIGSQQWIPNSGTKNFHTQLGIGYRFNR